MEKYRLQRRIVGPAYSPNSVKDLEPLLDAQLSKHMTIMHEKSNKTVDINLWCSKISLGESSPQPERGCKNKGTD